MTYVTDENNERQIEARFHALLEAIDSNPPPSKNTMCLIESNKHPETEKGL
jgi:hypothetical protein